MNITEGKWLNNYHANFTQFEIEAKGKSVASLRHKPDSVFFAVEKEAKANAELIADAGNTAQKCNLLPSELLQQRDELLAALDKMINTWHTTETDIKEYRSLINKIKGNG